MCGCQIGNPCPILRDPVNHRVQVIITGTRTLLMAAKKGPFCTPNRTKCILNPTRLAPRIRRVSPNSDRMSHSARTSRPLRPWQPAPPPRRTLSARSRCAQRALQTPAPGDPRASWVQGLNPKCIENLKHWTEKLQATPCSLHCRAALDSPPDRPHSLSDSTAIRCKWHPGRCRHRPMPPRCWCSSHRGR
jgi:hypothetical protein